MLKSRCKKLAGNYPRGFGEFPARRSLQTVGLIDLSCEADTVHVDTDDEATWKEVRCTTMTSVPKTTTVNCYMFGGFQSHLTCSRMC